MISVAHDKVLSVRTDTPEDITTVIDRSRCVAEDEVLVNFGLGEAMILKNMGFKDVPSPIRTQYKWSGVYKPFDHQRATAEFLTLNKRAYILSDMGTGKTNAVIWAADYLMHIGVIKKVLIICPLSIMDAAWRKDLFRTAMHRSVAIAHGTREKRVEIIETRPDFTIINYDGIEIIERSLIQQKYDLIVIDELTHLKTANTQRWKAHNRLITPDTWVWGMTGTPAAQSPVDAHGMVRLITPSRIPQSLTTFRNIMQYKVSNFTWVNKPEAADIVYDMLQPAIRYTKEECLDLPDLIYQTRDIPLTKQQDRYYKVLKQEMLMTIAGETISAANAAVAMNKLLQISSGSCYSETGEVIEFDIKPRVNELLDIIKETPHKVIVFVMFRHTIELVQKALKKEGYSVDCIHGGVASGKRNEVINDFQTKPDPRVLVIQPQAAAHGITLTKANTIVWWGITLSLETYLQANARIHRAGQTNKCNVVHLVGSQVERKILHILETKGTAQTKLLNLYKGVISS
jgi:SNF2 family DNA or RNA helicase